jgi:hypothetical protein
MSSITTAAGWKIRAGIGKKKGCDQQEAEKGQQQYRDRATHHT